VEIHKPKSWHGPGEFFREYLIIVVGVLTALGGEQAIEWMHRQTELAETHEALRAEIAHNSAVIALGSAMDRCRSAIYEKYVGWARGGPRPEKPPTVGFPGLSFSAWDVAKAGPLSRMPVQERLSYSQAYERLTAQQRNIERQIDVASTFAQYFDLEQLNPDQAQRVLELNTPAETIIAVKDRLASEFLSNVQALGISPEPVAARRQASLNELCQAAGLPVPTL